MRRAGQNPTDIEEEKDFSFFYLSLFYLFISQLIVQTFREISFNCCLLVESIPHWPLPAVRDLTRDGRLSTYDESVLKLSKVLFREKCGRTEHPLKPYHHQQDSPGWVIFLQLARRAAVPARCSILYLFSG